MKEGDGLKNGLVVAMESVGLYYEEIISLNLRPREGTVLMVFQREKPVIKNNPFYAPPKRNLMAIQTVMRVSESIPFFREYLHYHMNLGVDLFFIYDNDGTSGTDVSYGVHASSASNKYGLNLQCISTEEKTTAELESIWEEFYGHIVFIPWQPLWEG